MAATGRTVIITGAGSGIGAACARKFAQAGDRVAIIDIDDAAGKAVEADIRESGGEALFIHADITERLDIHNLLAETIDVYSRVDVLINNAAVFVAGDFLELLEEEFDQCMDVNLKGAFLTSQAVARRFVEQIKAESEAGADLMAGQAPAYSIINISSVQGVTAAADLTVYAASKAGLTQLTKATSLALAPYGIRVNAIGPGAINTGAKRDVLDDAKSRKQILSRTPLGRIGDPGEVASVAFFLASREASYITGQCIYVEGGRLALNYLSDDGSGEKTRSLSD